MIMTTPPLLPYLPANYTPSNTGQQTPPATAQIVSEGVMSRRLPGQKKATEGFPGGGEGVLCVGVGDYAD